MKSFTAIKKEADKYTWELYCFSNSGLPQDNQHHKFINQIRKVEKLQSNAIKFEGGSWLYFPKADCVTIEKYLYNDNDVIIKLKEEGFPILGYHLRPINN